VLMPVHQEMADRVGKDLLKEVYECCNLKM